MINYKFIRNLITECSYKDVAVYLCLLTYNGKGRCFPTRKTVASILKLKNPESVSERFRRLEKKGYLKRVLYTGRSSEYHLPDSKIENKSKNKYVSQNLPSFVSQEAPSFVSHEVPSCISQETPPCVSHEAPSCISQETPPCVSREIPLEKINTPSVKNPQKTLANICHNSSHKFLKGNIKGKGNIHQKLLSNPFYKPMHEFLEYFSEKYEEKLGIVYSNLDYYKNGILILKKLENNITLDDLKMRCDVFFERKSWWARENNFTLGAFANDNIFNTLVYTKHEQREHGESRAPLLTKENYFELTGVHPDEN